MTGIDLASAFLVVIGAAGWLNARYLRLPSAAVMVIAGLSGATVLLLLRATWPELRAPEELISAILAVDFPEAVLGYILGLLLFAGAMQVDLSELGKRTISVLSLATVGVLASIATVGLGIWGFAQLLGLHLSMSWSLVFGALISPTDPIAVLAAVRHGGLSKRLVAVLQGEALFNDGVGIVVFTALAALAVGGDQLHPMAEVSTIAVEAIGGVLLGWLAGSICIRAMRAIDDYAAEVILTLALAMGVYTAAHALGLSAPLAVVAAGLIVGDRRRSNAMSDLTQRYVRAFWSLIDEILNAVLFLLLGLEILAVPFDLRLGGLWIAAIILVVTVRFVVVLPWGAYFRFHEHEKGANVLLAWGGLHGALSLALALTLPAGEARALILPTTFAVVIFSVLVQGLTFGHLARRFAGKPQQ